MPYTKGQASPPDVAASATLSPWFGLSRWSKLVVIPVGINVLAGLRSDPQLPSQLQ